MTTRYQSKPLWRVQTLECGTLYVRGLTREEVRRIVERLRYGCATTPVGEIKREDE